MVKEFGQFGKKIGKKWGETVRAPKISLTSTKIFFFFISLVEIKILSEILYFLTRKFHLLLPKFIFLTPKNKVLPPKFIYLNCH
jgi:hypothetical protein